MDLDILHIRLTAYALGELDAAQKADIERILTESQDARDQVARTKNIAKAIKDLLPQNAEDVQPMTPAEYRARLAGEQANAASGSSTELPAQAAATTPAGSAASGGMGLIWLLGACCVLLAIGWLWQFKAAPAASPKETVTLEEFTALKSRLTEANQAVSAAREALEKELVTKAEIEKKITEAAKNSENMQETVDALEEEKKDIEIAHAKLESALARAEALAAAFHQPFVATQARPFLTVPASASNQTLELVAESLKNGALPPPDQVDISDLVQSIKYTYAAPAPGQKLPALACTIASCPWAEGHLLARITLTAGTEAAALSALQVEFNPSTVASWRTLGREVKLTDGGISGGQGTGELKSGATLTLLVELTPVSDPMLPLAAKREDLARQMAETKRMIAGGGESVALAEAKLRYEDLRLDLQDLDAAIAKIKVAQTATWRYSQPARPTAEAASGEFLAVTATFTDAKGQLAPVQTTLGGSAKAFTDTDADFRLASAAAALGMVLHQSPDRGSAGFDLVNNLLKDLPQGNEGVKTLTSLTQQAAEIHE